MLEGVHMILGNRYAYTIFIDNNLIYSDWGCKYCLFPWGALQKITEKHCFNYKHIRGTVRGLNKSGGLGSQ